MSVRRLVVAAGMGAVVVATSLFSVLDEDKKGGRATNQSGPTEACSSGDGTPPTNATDISKTRADVDGDGRRETIYFYRQPPGKEQEPRDQPGKFVGSDAPWLVRAEVANGLALGTLPSFGSPKAIGPTDLNVNGREEVWYDPRDGATAHSVAAVILAGCRLVNLHDGDGTPTALLRSRTGLASPGVTVGTQCADLDGDGRKELVETTYSSVMQADPSEGDNLQTGSETWAYRLFSINGMEVVKLAETLPSRTKPKVPFTFEAGFNCGGIRYVF